jgi:hypothetical protein
MLPGLPAHRVTTASPGPDKLLRNEVWAPQVIQHLQGGEEVVLEESGSTVVRRRQEAAPRMHRVCQSPRHGPQRWRSQLRGPHLASPDAAETKRAAHAARPRTSRIPSSTSPRQTATRCSCDTGAATLEPNLRWRSSLGASETAGSWPGTPISAAGERAPLTRARSPFAATRLATVIAHMALGRARRQEMR